MLLVSAIIITGCGTKNEGVKAETKTEYFDFTESEMVDKLSTDWLIDFTPIAVVDNKEKTGKIASYTAEVPVLNMGGEGDANMMHYLFAYDDTTNEVSHISFFTNRDEQKAAEYFLYHIYAISQSIDQNANTDDITTAIKNGFNECDFATYNGVNFELNAFRNDEYFDASFTPIQNTKGD